jgi:hypothetical protein
MRKVCSIAFAAMLGIAAPAFVAQSADLPYEKGPQCPPNATLPNGDCCPVDQVYWGTGFGCINPALIYGAAGAALLGGAVAAVIITTNNNNQNITPQP